MQVCFVAFVKVSADSQEEGKKGAKKAPVKKPNNSASLSTHLWLK